MHRKIVLFLALILFNISVSFAQRSFSVKPDQYIKDLKKYMSALKDDQIDSLTTVFEGSWKSGAYTFAQKRMIIGLTNQMLNKRLRAKPHFFQYLSCVNAVTDSAGPAKFNEWHRIANEVMMKNSRKYAKFIEISNGLLNYNIILSKNRNKWTTSNNNYKFSIKGKNPVITFGELNLYCFTTGDTIRIDNTSGVYRPFQESWDGQAGRVYWTRVGLDTSKVFCDLRDYKIDLARSNFKADSVSFYNKLVFDKPLLGSLEEKAFGGYTGKRSQTPYFKSYNKDIDLTKLVKGIDFNAGFAMRGAKVIGAGTQEQKASLIFYYEDNKALKANALEFIITEKNKIVTDKAEVIIYINNDSIYHPQLELVYDIDSSYLKLFRGKKGITSAPFFDSFHQVEFYCEQIGWQVGNPNIEIDMIQDDLPAVFQSSDYFRDIIYERVQGLLQYNPIRKLKEFSEDNDTVKTFTLSEYAAYYGKIKDRLMVQMVDLHDKGFIYFDMATEVIQLKDKAINYVNAHNKRTDFDVINFRSIISAYNNASINLINYDLNLQGVPTFNFSDSQNVYVVPYNQEINIKKDRTLEFSGKIGAGLFEFYGKNFTFDYTTFSIKLENVDSMKFSYPDSTDRGKPVPVQSVLRDIYGTLYIDHPGNKSGLKDYPEYPIFTSEKGSKVTYEYKRTQGGSYDAERFYFAVDPFTVDSLDNFSIEGLTYEGTFVSGGIMPDIKYQLSIQPDNSLGFVKETPAGGYPLYGGKGKGEFTMSLSNEGLFGNGNIDYLAAKLESDKFTFLLDSMNADVEQFHLDQTSIYPEVDGADVYVHWRPYQDSMYVDYIKDSIQMFAGRASLKGGVMLTPTNLSGHGIMSWEGADLTSSYMDYTPHTLDAAKADFSIASLDPDKAAFATKNVKAFVDYKKRYADFRTNELNAKTELSYNQYVVDYSDFRWDMDPKTITMENKPSRSLGRFTSIHPKQDSLTFKAEKGIYSLENYFVDVKKVPNIDVADSRIFPDSGKVMIEPNAVMQTLKNAKIITDTVDKYHNIVKAEIKVLGRLDFEGTGYYTYVTKQKKKHEIFFDAIGVNRQGLTVGRGTIADSAEFELGERILFQGTSVLTSNQKNLEYDGYVLTQQNLNFPKSQWFRYGNRIGPDSVIIDIDRPRNKDKNFLSVGVNISTDSTHMYTSFFSKKRRYTDLEVLNMKGKLQFDDQKKEFIVGDSSKMFDPNAVKGNIMTINDETGIINAEGKINLDLNKNPSFQVQTAGEVVASTRDTTFEFDVAMLMAFDMPEEALKLMAERIASLSSSATDVENSRPVLRKALAEFIDDKNQERVLGELKDYTTIRMVPELTKTMLITDLQMKWNTKTRSFLSVGKIGLGAVGKTKLDRKFLGKMEIIRKRSGTEFNFYIEIDEDNWYFFKFYRNVMYIIGGDPAFNQVIKDNLAKGSTDQYRLRFGSRASLNNFRKGIVQE